MEETSIKLLNGTVLRNDDYFIEKMTTSADKHQNEPSNVIKFINVRKKRRGAKNNKNDNHNRNYGNNHNGLSRG